MQTLAEDLLLLALDDDRGMVSWRRSTALPYGLGGALLMDLVLARRIDTVDTKVVVLVQSLTGEDVLDAALATIRDSTKPRDATHWVKTLGRRKGLKHQLARRLVARGILREEEHRFLWVFNDPRFPTSDPGTEASLRARLRDVVLAGAEPDPHTLMLLSLVKACNLTDALVSGNERKRARQRVNALVEGEQFGAAVGKAVAEAAAAAAAVATGAAYTVTVAPGASH